MTTRSLIRRMIPGAFLAVALAGPGFAADMPSSYVPPQADAGPSAACTLAGRHHRPADEVDLPPQPAYIVAERCGPSSYWLDTVMMAPRYEEILVYYNGGSMNRTDVTLLRVPPWAAPPH